MKHYMKKEGYGFGLFETYNEDGKISLKDFKKYHSPQIHNFLVKYVKNQKCPLEMKLLKKWLNTYKMIMEQTLTLKNSRNL